MSQNFRSTFLSILSFFFLSHLPARVNKLSPWKKTNRGPVAHGPWILNWAPKLWEKMPIPLMLNIHFWQRGPLSQNPCVTLAKRVAAAYIGRSWYMFALYMYIDIFLIPDQIWTKGPVQVCSSFVFDELARLVCNTLCSLQSMFRCGICKKSHEQTYGDWNAIWKHADNEEQTLAFHSE